MNNILFVARLVLVALLSFSLAIAQSERLVIQVIEGQGAIHNVKRGTAFEPVIEVQDGAGKPVAEASVTFTLPAVGPSASFPDGSRSLLILTDTAGRAIARGLRPNTVVGPYEIRVSAVSGADRATTVINQTNAAPASAETASGKKWAVILGIVGAAAAGGVIAATGGGGSSRTPTTPSDPAAGSGSITPGTPGFGPPRP